MNEAIIIAGDVRVVVAEAEGNKVRQEVEAPRDVRVDREEIHLRKRGPTRGPPEVFTRQEYDLLADRGNCEPATFCGRQMHVREVRAWTHC
jgi:hypothetical protein